MEGLKDSAAGKNRIYVDFERIAELCELARNLNYSSKGLSNMNELLYKNRGRKTLKKSVSARNNGKLGGRPPKEITQARRLLEQLEEIDFSINQKLTDEQKKELKDAREKIKIWETERKRILDKKSDLS